MPSRGRDESLSDTATAPESASETPENDVLVLEDVCKAYHISRPPRTVLDRVSLRVRRGEFVALMGPSGSGKSTLLHVLGGLEPPDSGRVLVEGRDLYAMDDGTRSSFRRDHIGVVFQFFNLIPSLTAAENIALPLTLREGGRGRARITRTEIHDRVAVLMDQLNLRGLQGHGPEEVSGGEQQRVAIARALAAAPSLLLADEPTGNLDWSSGHEVMSLLSRLCRSQQQTTVLVTHDARVAVHADRVIVVRDGNIIDEVGVVHGDDETVPDVAPLVARLREHDL
ncbi:MAG: ABC transporter ATP-binding protein [Candidatus Dormibacteria bacterium]